MQLEILAIPAFNDNYIWTLVNRDNKCAVCVDPGEAQPVITKLTQENITLAAILVTHHHWDHTNGINELVSHYQNIPVFGPAQEAIPHITDPLSESDQVTLKMLDLELNVLDIPGHTLGHIAYYNQAMLFCGDTLFLAGCGRIFEGTVEQMYNSINKLSNLPDDVLVYCGHEYTEANLNFARAVEPDNEAISQRLQQTHALRQQNKASVPAPLRDERLTNPFLRCEQAVVRSAAEKASGKTLNTPAAVFGALRQWKNNF